MHADNEATVLLGNGRPGTRVFEQAVREVSLVTTSTNRLAANYRSFRSDIAVCPNFMPDDVFTSLAPAKIDGKPKVAGEIRVGYAGGSTHGADLALIYQPLRKLCARYPNVKLVFFGQQLPPLYRPLLDRIEYHGYQLPMKGDAHYEFMNRYFATLKELSLDIAIAPIIPSTFNAGKSYLKALEYGACGYPVVASSFGPYREYAKGGGAILTAFDEGEWLRHLGRLIENEAMRRELAESNLVHVKERHNTAEGIKPWLAAIACAANARPLASGAAL